MKNKMYALTMMLLVIIGCSKNQAPAPIILQVTNGNYIGIFERNGAVSNVQLNLSNGAFNGQSTTDKFPALCDGTYATTGNTITFENKCIWTAEFDWTLILNNTWTFTTNGPILTLTKANGDKYVLTQQ